MRVCAVLVLTDRVVSTSTLGDFARGERSPLACVEVLGQSVLEHTIARLQRTGIKNISVVGGRGFLSSACSYRVEIAHADTYSDRWIAADCLLTKYARQGVDTVFLMEIGAYAEIDYVDALRFHFDSCAPVTQLFDARGSLKAWVANAAAFRRPSDVTASLFEASTSFSSYLVKGYVNHLSRAADLRQLVIDAFLQRCTIRPNGREVKPGVWMGDGAYVHSSARIVAPAYLGSSTILGASTLVTRFSNVERQCRVGRGTVVDASSVLAHTVLGEGLDVAKAVVDGNEFVDLNRNLAVQIEDPKLVRGTARRPAPKLPVDGFDPATHPVPSFEFAYSQHIARAAGRLSEVFRGQL